MTFSITHISELSTVAQHIVALTPQHSIICFYGEMGAGKTTLIKLIAQQLGVQQPVTSPTYSLVNEYSTAKGSTVYHFDFYRINSITEAYDMGLEEYVYSGNICLIEWPQNVAELLPTHLQVHITKTGEESRDINVTVEGV